MFRRSSLKFLWSTIRLVLFLIYLGRVVLFIDGRFWSFSCKLWVSCNFHRLLMWTTKRRLFYLVLVLSALLRIVKLLLCVLLSEFCTTLMDKLVTTMFEWICMECSTIRHQWWRSFIRWPCVYNLRCILGLLLTSQVWCYKTWCNWIILCVYQALESLISFLWSYGWRTKCLLNTCRWRNGR